jgi:hypothetical protein
MHHSNFDIRSGSKPEVAAQLQDVCFAAVTDIVSPATHVRKVPNPEVVRLIQSPGRRAIEGSWARRGRGPRRS